MAQKFNKRLTAEEREIMGYEPEARAMPVNKAIFIQQYLKHGVGSRAAEEAGVSANPKTVRVIAHNLIHSDPEVMKAISNARALIKKEIGYTALSAMKECEDAMEFARATDNANALVKAIELRSKIQGLLVEKVDMRLSAQFSVNISGIEDDEPINVTPVPSPQPLDDEGILE